MADTNKSCELKSPGEMEINFTEVCRFCLSKTESDFFTIDTCLLEESEEAKRESLWLFLKKLRFVKMENPVTFPTRVCKNCYQLIQVCYHFEQLCQKSNRLLQDYYENRVKETENGIAKGEKKILDSTSEKDHPPSLSLKNEFSEFPTQVEDIKKMKCKISRESLIESVNILNNYKQKLSLFSDKGVQVQIKDFNITQNEKLKPVHGCTRCSLKFSSLGALNIHCVVAHGQGKFKTLLKIQCKNCEKSFVDVENLQRHYKMTHKTREIPEELLNNKVKHIFAVEKKEFQFQDELKKHFKVSHENEMDDMEKVCCTFCDLTFPTRFTLKEHELLVHEQKEGKCTLEMQEVEKCRDKSVPAFLKVLDSVVDTLSVGEGRGFQVLCKKCTPPREFSEVNEFARHLRRHYGETGKEGGWRCSECPATYSRKQTLCCHMREKHKRVLKGMKCPEAECSESFATNRQLILHGITVHQKYFACFHEVFNRILREGAEEGEVRAKDFECDVCQKKYIYKSSLRKHILTTHSGKPGDESVVCPHCGKTISSKLNLKSHIEFVHKALFVSCPICRKKINFRTIGKHYKTHRTTAEMVESKNSFLCNLCGKILKSKRSFEDHQKLHKNARDEVCDVCGSGFTTKKFLRLHKKTHEGGPRRKAFACDQCEKVFSGRHTLNRHLLTHSGTKNFICEMCSKCFYTLQELNRHVRYHKKEYRFDCQLCDMRFLDKSRFRHHMMRHRNVRPHKCHFCEKMFIVRGKMNSHMATKHNFEVQNTKGSWKDPKTYVPLDDLL